MQSSTYGDIIEDKLAEWQGDIKRLEEQAKKSSSDSFKDEIVQLRKAITAAAQDLDELDKQETAGNTMETKARILKIFDTIDRELRSHSETSPYML